MPISNAPESAQNANAESHIDPVNSPVIDSEALIEEVSIDGMCGVY